MVGSKIELKIYLSIYYIEFSHKNKDIANMVLYILKYFYTQIVLFIIFDIVCLKFIFIYISTLEL